MSRSLPTVKDIRAWFEARSKPTAATTRPHHHHPPHPKIGTLAYIRMYQSPGISRILNPFENTIDSVLDTDPAQLPPTTLTLSSIAPPAPGRPTLSSRPSWIGPKPPERQATSGLVPMKQPVAIEYASPGLQPPVFVFTSLSDPQWDAVEMDHEKNDGGEYLFFKTFSAEEGEYQYKFRLGPGDWWELDHNKPVVDDGAGNKNNLLVVKPIVQPQVAHQPQTTSQPPTFEQESPTQAQPNQMDQSTHQAQMEVEDQADVPVIAHTKQSVLSPEQLNLSEPPPTAPSPTPAILQKVSIEQPAPITDQAATAQQTLPANHVDPIARTPTMQQPMIQKPGSMDLPEAMPQLVNSAVTPGPTPLMEHETFDPDNDTIENVQGDYECSSRDDDDGEPESASSPLLRHESITPDSDEQTQAPLLQHESSGLGQHQDEPDDFASRLSSYGSLSRLAASCQSSAPDTLIAPEAEPHDLSLERFPTDQIGILEKIHHASVYLAKDETFDDLNVSSPLLAVSDTSISPVVSLPSVREDREGELAELQKFEDEAAMELEELRKIEEEEVGEEADTEEIDPTRPTFNVTNAEQRPAVPMTPPMTPKEAVENIERLTEEEQTDEYPPKSTPESDTGLAATDQQGIEYGQELQEKIIVEIVQERSIFETMLNLMVFPATWLVAAIAFAIGIWKSRYA